MIRTYHHYFFVLSLLIGPSCSLLYAEESEDPRFSTAPLMLESPILKFIDGKTGLGIDGQVYLMIMKLRLQFKRMRFGNKQKNSDAMENSDTLENSGVLVGYFTYNDAPIMLADLVILESQGIDLSNLLAAAKKDADIKIRPLLYIARGAKKHMVILISEWASKAHRVNSQLLDWANTPEGQEQQALDERIKTFKQFEQFVDDLVYYLETLLRSCPKAYKQFKDLIDQKIQEQQKST